MGLFDLLVAALLFVNSVAILNEERFLAKCKQMNKFILYLLTIYNEI